MKGPDKILPYTPSSMTVVIIDDHDPIRKAIRRVLIGMGFLNVMEFFDGYDALKALSKSAIAVDLIITDIYMRKITGFQVLKKIRGNSFEYDIPIIMVTGEGSKEDIVKAADLGADDYIIKPFQISDIEKKVNTVLIKYHSPPPFLKMIRQGERLLFEEQFIDALKLFEAAERLEPSSARAQYCKALALEKMGHAGDALKVLKESISNNATYYKNYAAIADIHLKGGRTLLAIEAIKSELELNPKQAPRQALLADMLMAEGDHIGALEHYREALKENPKMKEALFGMGRAYDASDNHDKAIYYFKRARRQHPGLTQALELIVNSFDARNAGQKAIPVLLDDIRDSPNRSDARILVSKLYTKFNEIEKALKILDDGLIRDPSSITLLRAKAKFLLESRDAPTAVLLYQKVVALDPSSLNHTLLGLALMHDNKFKESISALLTAIQDSSDKSKILSLISEVLKRTGGIIQAHLILQLALKNAESSTKKFLEADLKSLALQIRERRSLPKTSNPRQAS